MHARSFCASVNWGPLIILLHLNFLFGLNLTPNFLSCSSVHQEPLRNRYLPSLVLVSFVVLKTRSRRAPSSIVSSGGGDRGRRNRTSFDRLNEGREDGRRSGARTDAFGSWSNRCIRGMCNVRTAEDRDQVQILISTS